MGITKNRRKPGFYWVKVGANWEVGEWSEGDYWFLPGLEDKYIDTDLELIKENRLIEPDN